jgi:hypothetical protein
VVGFQAGCGQTDLCGQRDRIAHRAALGQHRGRAGGEFGLQVGGRQAAGEQGGSLSERKRQIIQSLGEAVAVRVAEDGAAGAEQGEGLGPGEDADVDGGGVGVPVWVAGGDQTWPGPPGR